MMKTLLILVPPLDPPLVGRLGAGRPDAGYCAFRPLLPDLLFILAVAGTVAFAAGGLYLRSASSSPPRACRQQEPRRSSRFERR